MIKLMLNAHKFNNYAFFCPVSKLHVTVSNPVGYVNEVTAAILKALKSQTLLDVDGVVDIETGTVKDGADVKISDDSKQPKAPKQPETPEKEPEVPKKEQEKEPEKAAEESKNEDDNNSKQEPKNTDNTEEVETAEKSKKGRKKANAE